MNPCLNIIKEFPASLIISIVNCNCADLLSHLLFGSIKAEGGGSGTSARAFNGAVLGYEMKNINHFTKSANDNDGRRSGGEGERVFEKGKHGEVC